MSWYCYFSGITGIKYWECYHLFYSNMSSFCFFALVYTLNHNFCNKTTVLEKPIGALFYLKLKKISPKFGKPTHLPRKTYLFKLMKTNLFFSMCVNVDFFSKFWRKNRIKKINQIVTHSSVWTVQTVFYGF